MEVPEYRDTLAGNRGRLDASAVLLPYGTRRGPNRPETDMPTRRIRHSLAVPLFLVIFGLTSLIGHSQKSLKDEESQDYYTKWLKEDVVYIITDEERSVFQSLTTDEEKERFIEQFWFRRDSDPTTSANEFKEEHYRRLAYVDDHFSSGLPGWMTDRGRTYIIHGPPDEIEKHPSGGHYTRPAYEGGGSTVTYPFEVWRYRYIEGIGDDIELEFVDPTMTAEYRLALRPEEKDALLHIPEAGLTRAEEMGLATKADRPFFSSTRAENYPLMVVRRKDNPFTRYETYAKIQRPPKIKYPDLKEIVDINVSYSDLPVQVGEDYFRLNEQEVLVPITLGVENKNLTFESEGNRQVAHLAVYGSVTSITNRIVSEFEQDLQVSGSAGEFPQKLQRTSIYQKVIPLDRKLRYKLVLVVKDLTSKRVGVVRKALIPPTFGASTSGLGCSSLVLADQYKVLKDLPGPDEAFVIGDVKVRPRIDGRFEEGSLVWLYFHLYDVPLDQATLGPSLKIAYRIVRDGKTLVEGIDDQGTSVQYFSEDRVVVARPLSLQGLAPGKYQVTVHAADRVEGRSVDLTAPVEIMRTGDSASSDQGDR